MPFTISLWYLIAVLIVAFLLPQIPVVGKFFNIINTAIHELGHALMALVTNGEVLKIKLFKDTSGTTTTKSKSKVSSILISLAGYPFAASVAWLCFYLITREVCSAILIALSVLFVVMLLLWIRNIYGAVWVVFFCALNGFLLYYGNAQYVFWAALFYAVMMITESVHSSLVILYISVISPHEAGDAANLMAATGIPSFFWSLLFIAYTGWVTYKVVLLMLPIVVC